MEQVTLAAPEYVDPGTGRYVVRSLVMNIGVTYDWSGALVITPASSQITVVLAGDQRHEVTHSWAGQVAHDDIIALNKVNLTITSLQKRIMQRLIALGKLVGNITGAVD